MFNIHSYSNPKRTDDSKRPDPAEEARKRELPRSDFKKIAEPPSKEESEKAANTTEEDPPSLFDLSRNKSKPKKGTGNPQKQTGQEETTESTLLARKGTLSQPGDQEPGEETLLMAGSLSEEDQASQEFFGTVPPSPKKEKGIESPLNQQMGKGQEAAKGEAMAATIQQTTVKKEGSISQFEEGEKGPTEKTGKKEKGGKSSESPSTQEKGSGSAVNSAIQGVGGSGGHGRPIDEGENLAQASPVRAIADQIADKIQVMKTNGMTETLVTLKNPPLLEGATITLTEFSHAKGEFNIKFANLSPEAKRFLDAQLLQDPLQSHLDRKGIVVHMVSTTTQSEPLVKTDTDNASNQQNQEREKEEQKGQKREQQQQEDETES